MAFASNVSKSNCVSWHEIRDNVLTLSSLVSSDEQGELIEHNIKLIMKNQKVIADQQRSPKTNDKLVAKANENIQMCIETIKIRLGRLGASKDVITEAANDINNGNIPKFTLKVLELMATKNPGLHQRKYNQALQMVAAQQRQH